jgi:hypothetical protein
MSRREHITEDARLIDPLLDFRQNRVHYAQHLPAGQSEDPDPCWAVHAVRREHDAEIQRVPLRRERLGRTVEGDGDLP